MAFVQYTNHSVYLNFLLERRPEKGAAKGLVGSLQGESLLHTGGGAWQGVAGGLHHGEHLCSRVSLVGGLFSRVFY